jgi:hypothetical protein
VNPPFWLASRSHRSIIDAMLAINPITSNVSTQHIVAVRQA